jgi:signal transduction histidine kinase
MSTLAKPAATDYEAQALQATLEAVDTGIAVISDAGSIETCNERLFTMLDRAGMLAPGLSGKPAAELAGLTIAELAPALQQHPERAKGPGGREFQFSYKMDPAGFKGTLIQVRDVTGQVIDAKAIDSAREQADMIEKARTAFVSQVAHHFRTPLHVILGYVDILADSGEGALDRVTRDSYLQFIRESASALLLNMNEMMEIIRLQRSEQEVEFEVRRLGVVLQNVIAEVQPTLEAEDVTLEADNAVAQSLEFRSMLDMLLVRRGLSSLLRTCAVLGGGGSVLKLDAETRPDGQLDLVLAFKPGRASPADIVSSIETGEPVKEISLTGRASGYGIVLAALLLKLCRAEVAAQPTASRQIRIVVTFAPAVTY